MANNLDSEEEIMAGLSYNSDSKFHFEIESAEDNMDNRLHVEKDTNFSEPFVRSINSSPKPQDYEDYSPNNCNSADAPTIPSLPSIPAPSGSGDADSSGGASGNTCATKAVRLERLKVARDLYERERQRKLLEILESQKSAVEFRERQKEERRKKLEEMKKREDERRQLVEDRRRRMQDAEQERRLEMLRRQDDRESRSTTRRSQTQQRGVFGFGSGTPREICMPLRLAQSSANMGALLDSACGAVGDCADSAHMRSHRRTLSATAACRNRTTVISTPDLCVTASPFGHVDRPSATGLRSRTSSAVCALAPSKKSASNTALNVTLESDGCNSFTTNSMTASSQLRKSVGVAHTASNTSSESGSTPPPQPHRRARPHSMVVARSERFDSCMTASVQGSLSSSPRTRTSTFKRMSASVHGTLTTSTPPSSKINDRRVTKSPAALVESPAPAANAMKRSRSTGAAMNTAAATPSINTIEKPEVLSESLNSKKKTRSTTSLLAPGAAGTSTPVGRMADKKNCTTTPRSSSVSVTSQEGKNVAPTSTSTADSPSRSVSRSRGTGSATNAASTTAAASAICTPPASAEINEEQLRQNKEAAKQRAAAIMAKVEEAKRASEEKRLAEEAALRRLEEQARLRREAEEQRRVEEEQRRAAEEEAARVEAERLIEEAAKLEEERRLALEAEERVKREEVERERAERAQKEEQERVERKRRLESIMKRVKLGDAPREASPSPTNEFAAAAAASSSLSVQEEQLNNGAASCEAEGTSYEATADSAATLEVPEAAAAAAAATSTPLEAAAPAADAVAGTPQFRSALLQSMMTGSGRLGSSRAAEILSKHSGSSGNLRLLAAPDVEPTLLQNGYTPSSNNLMTTSLPPGSAAAAILAHRRQSSTAAVPTSYSSPQYDHSASFNGQLEDADEEVDQPALVCSNLHARLVESRAFAQDRSSPKYELSNDNSGLKSFEQVICLETSLLSNSNSSNGWMIEQTPSVVSDAS